MRTILKMLLFLFLLNAFQSCTQEDGETEAQINKPLAAISDMSPLIGPKGTTVTFSGTNFGTDAAQVQVFFDAIEAEVLSVSDTEI